MILATIHSYEELVDALRLRRHKFSFNTLTSFTGSI